MSPMRYFINAAINTDDIVVPLNIHHDHGYAKLSSQSCMPSSNDHGSPVNVDDTSDVPVSLSPSSDHSVCNSQKENSEDSDPEYVVADDSDITDDDSSSSDTNEKQRKCCCLHTKKLISLFCTCKKASILCLLPVGSIPLNMCSDDMQLTDTF
ncbi:hypothetical protein NP493_2151g00004 [Ridgeia piscesae]|uniref:Uncharacterized protein n=1 Tax=Ridgeia piscesae TaxID=27915 RepID=A0AAD9JL80_RIDPI|nr:hypothetical protein NP493_2151g00004 [Ridgeia piscesae]